MRLRATRSHLLSLRSALPAGLLFAAAILAPTWAVAAEHVTLRNGFEFDCARREMVEGNQTRLFLLPSSAPADSARTDSSYIDVASDAVLRVEMVPDPPPMARPARAAQKTSDDLTPAAMETMLAHAGAQHHIDEDLLASVVQAESGGKTLAVSRTGARGLMQLMPGTATKMGVADSFRPEENIAGGTAYLDSLLVRYHDNAALALAAYNAGPGAVDKYHGVPPFRETRAYVARVIREFNRRKQQGSQLAKTQIAGLH